jgi:uncharacterized membrane protein (DUF373 family)
MDRFLAQFEVWVVRTVQLLVSLTVTFTLGLLVYLLFVEGLGRLAQIHSVPELQPLVLRAFGGALLVLLGLELLDSLKTFAVAHEIRLEMILIVSTIAVARHIILLDFEHASGTLLLGISALLLALTAGFALVKRAKGAEGDGGRGHK